MNDEPIFKDCEDDLAHNLNEPESKFKKLTELKHRLDNKVKFSYQKKVIMLLAVGLSLIPIIFIPLITYVGKHDFLVPVFIMIPFSAIAAVWFLIPNDLGEFDSKTKQSNASFISKNIGMPLLCFCLLFPMLLINFSTLSLLV